MYEMLDCNKDHRDLSSSSVSDSVSFSIILILHISVAQTSEKGGTVVLFVQRKQNLGNTFINFFSFFFLLFAIIVPL